MMKISPNVPIIGNGNQGRLITRPPLSNGTQTALKPHGATQASDAERNVDVLNDGMFCVMTGFVLVAGG